jgi:hypothetical protein
MKAGLLYESAPLISALLRDIIGSTKRVQWGKFSVFKKYVDKGRFKGGLKITLVGSTQIIGLWA